MCYLISRLMRVMYVLLTVQPHTILRDKRYLLDLTLTNANVNTISSTVNLIEGFERANIMLPNGTRFHINDPLILENPQGIFLALKIYVEKDITSKP